MKILAIETSAKSVSAAVVEGGVPLASAYQNRGLTHSRTLMPLLDGGLKKLQCPPAFFAVDKQRGNRLPARRQFIQHRYV